MSTRYDSCTVSAAGVARIDRIKDLAESLAGEFDQVPSREGSLALTHLQTAVMFGVRAVSLSHSAPLVPGQFAAAQIIEAVAVADLCKSFALGVVQAPQWLLDRVNAGTLLVTETTVRLELPSKLEGAAGWNDWIVRYADGTILPMPADTFEALFGVQPAAIHAR